MNTPDDIARPWLASYKEGVPHTLAIFPIKRLTSSRLLPKLRSLSRS